jgi:PQQ-dependent catabolism-associated CXXCW motif protein
MSKARRCIRAALFCLLTLAGIANAAQPDEPDDYRQDNYRAPVPATLKGARVIDTEGLIKLLATEPRLVVIDVLSQEPRPPRLAPESVWLPPPHEGLPGALWLPNVGYGQPPPAVLGYFTDSLKQLTAGDVDRPVAFYCRASCWMSWNAARRALSLGYRQVIWYPDGIDGWRQAGQKVAILKAFGEAP